MALWTDLEGLTIAGRYELWAHLATGGMAAVYRGWDHRMERPVAVKLLRGDGGGDGGGDDGVAHHAELERFRREARAVAALRSPHIVEVYDFIVDGGRTYLIMELVDGPNLKQRIQDSGPLPVAEALTYAIHVCRALAQAHAHGYIHRDIKPQNILLAPSGVTKLTDFGIVHVGGGPSLTASGLVLGTADYIAPEQAQGLTLEPASDLYSLGIVLYEMLTAAVPFTGATATAVALRHTTEPLPPLRLRNPDVPPLVERVVQRATAKDAALRFTRASQMEAVLTHALAVYGHSAPTSPTAPAPPAPPTAPPALSLHPLSSGERGSGGDVRATSPLAMQDLMPGVVQTLDSADEPDTADEPDWHDVALLLSASPWRPAGDPLALDEPLGDVGASGGRPITPVALPPDVDLTPWERPAHSAYLPLGAMRFTLPGGMGARLAWTLGAVLLLCVAVLVLRMLP